MSFTERAGLFPVLLLTGCASPVVVTGPPSGSVVDSYLTRSAADISAMQYRLHQSGPSAQRPGQPAGLRKGEPLLSRQLSSAPLSRSAGSTNTAGSGPADGFIRQPGAAPSLRAALRSIVPPGQTVVFDKAVSADAPELWRWTGNDRWPYVAGRMLATKGLKATVNVKTNTVTVAPAQRAQTARATGQSVSSPVPVNAHGQPAPGGTVKPVTGHNPFRGGRPAAGVVSPVSIPVKTAVPPAPSVRVWKIERGTTLRQGYELWASQAVCPSGKPVWTVRWDTGTNYPIDYTLTFRAANFEDATAQLFNLWHRAQVPLFVNGYRQQCLVVISDAPPNSSPQPSQQE